MIELPLNFDKTKGTEMNGSLSVHCRSVTLILKQQFREFLSKRRM